MKRTIVLLLLVAARWPTAATAQPPPDPKPTVITLRPAAEPVPALKYRLVPEQIKLVPGNAAVFYHRGCLMWLDVERSYVATEKAQPGAKSERVDSLTLSNWSSGPIGEIP